MDSLIFAIIFWLTLTKSCAFGQYEQSPQVNYKDNNYPISNNDKPKKESSANSPVAILKQINRHNEDGSYTYGFEGADGSFKIETKSASGDVRGKYGFVDDSGKVRVVEYGANQHGFQPAGEGITVAPPTLVDETTNGIQQIHNENLQNYQHTQLAPENLPSQAPISTRAHSPNSGLSQRFDYEQRPPTSQVYNQGPVQFSPPFDHRLGKSIAPVGADGASDKYNGKVGVLDQLARDYALPKNTAPPLHDISFGYY